MLKILPEDQFENMGGPIQLPHQNPATFDEFVQMHQQIRHQATHEKLKKDLIEHMCALKGDNQNICVS